MSDTPIRELWEKYLEGTCTLADLERLRELIGQPDNKLIVDQLLLGAFTNPAYEEKGDYDIEDIVGEILGRVKEQKPAGKVRLLYKWRWAAACLILLLGAGSYFLTRSIKITPSAPSLATRTTDIMPGSNGAILTLSDGRQVVLDSLQRGVIARQSGRNLVLNEGSLAYDPATTELNSMVYNTLTTPKGRQFGVVLSDGTKVWLNAASSLRYPASFTGVRRVVEITGEAYFEVAKNAIAPFQVIIGNQAKIEVLGTHFNVNAYTNDKSIQTTLLEGSVRVVSPNAKEKAVVLKPGQQAQVLATAPDISVVNDLDLDKVMAWKNGLFDFDGASLQEVMQQLERWYNIEVVYEKNIPEIRFGGKMTRGLSLNDLLEALKGFEGTDLKFRLEQGRKLIVTR